MQHIKSLSHQVLGVSSKAFTNNALQSLWVHSIRSSRAAPRDRQTILHCLKLLFNRELIRTANSPAERKEIKLNPLNLYPGSDSFIFESLAVSHANKKLLKGRINTEQRVCVFRFKGSEIGRQRLWKAFSCSVYRVVLSDVGNFNVTIYSIINKSLVYFPSFCFNWYLKSHCSLLLKEDTKQLLGTQLLWMFFI